MIKTVHAFPLLAFLALLAAPLPSQAQGRSAVTAPTLITTSPAASPAAPVSLTPTSVRSNAPLPGDRIFRNDKISLSAAYPNPASAAATIEYDLQPTAGSARITLFNVLGNVVGEYPLARDARTVILVTANLNPGVYFYTLSLDNRSLVTRKLIVKH